MASKSYNRGKSAFANVSDKGYAGGMNAKGSTMSEGSNLSSGASSAKPLSTGKGDVRVGSKGYDRFGDNMSIDSEPARQSRMGNTSTASGPKAMNPGKGGMQAQPKGYINPAGSCGDNNSDHPFLPNTTKGM